MPKFFGQPWIQAEARNWVFAEARKLVPTNLLAPSRSLEATDRARSQNDSSAVHAVNASPWHPRRSPSLAGMIPECKARIQPSHRWAYPLSPPTKPTKTNVHIAGRDGGHFRRKGRDVGNAHRSFATLCWSQRAPPNAVLVLLSRGRT